MSESPETDAAAVGYMERTRRYYRALGYTSDYRWAHYDTAPFTRLRKPLGETRVALVTTSHWPGDWSEDNPPRREVWSGEVANAPDALYNKHLAWDKVSTHTRDRESYLPIRALQQLSAEGTVGGLAARFHGVPTDYSHRLTIEQDAPEILSRVVADGADAALLIPL